MKYKRVLLKLSGESLGGPDGQGIDEDMFEKYASEIKQLTSMGVQVAVVIGGGNIFRGLSGVKMGFDRVRGDQMGMLATVINSIGLSLSLKGLGVDAVVYSAT
ncbi:MAG: uridine monophosphate kinase, partial [Bacteroidales bacterium]|nr:uridine monophosphate kinase [Bacteroidales bacterium]